MKITIKSLTEKGFFGINNYFPNQSILANINKEIKNNQITITIKKDFKNDSKNKTWIAYIVQDLKKEHKIEPIKDYEIEVKFDET